MKNNAFAVLCAAAIGLIMLPVDAGLEPADLTVPRYAHIFVIIDENKSYASIMDEQDAPNIAALAKEYGNATQFFAETHPSEPNYVAIVGGSTFGIRDDGAFNSAGHTVNAPSLATQLETAGLTWKGYYESIPEPGSLATRAGLYASKHSGFLNFRSVQQDPARAQHIVGFDQLQTDLQNGNVPNFALIIPNLCNDMHGATVLDEPDCDSFSGLIRRGDSVIKTLVAEIMASHVWSSADNAAIVLTFDEDDSGGTQGCCGNDLQDPANAGGGHIPTIVITNHGPRHIADATPYSHYSLLRTIEDAFGIRTYLEHANAPGVLPMVPLFAK